MPVLHAEQIQKSNYCVELYGHNTNFKFEAPPLLLDQNIGLATLKQNNDLLNTEIVRKLTEQMDYYSTAFGMDDMAYILFTDKICNAIYNDANKVCLFKYAILKHKGYAVLLGYTQTTLTVYGKLGFKVLNAIYVDHLKLTYTDLTFSQQVKPKAENLYEEVVNTGRAFLMNEHRAPYYNAKKTKYSFHFEFEDFDYYFKGNVNQSLVEYYRELPDVEFSEVYLNYQLSDHSKNGLINALKEAVSNMDQTKAIDFILKFTQETFTYKNDAETLGKEKFSFPEEVLANRYSDCEDKSILFAYLSKEVLRVPSVALLYYYKNHLNVAVAYNHKTSYNFIYKNQKYLVCEPSGCGFAPGQNAYDVSKASIINW